MRVFLIHDARFFHDRLGPALAASSCRRSFGPIHNLVRELHDVLESAARRDRLTADERPLLLECHNLAFDRRLWRHLAGELLLYAAVETPSFPTAPDLLSKFVPADFIERLLLGSRDVTFGGVPYRPDHARLHDVADIQELTAALATIEPAAWSTEGLSEVPEEEREEERAFGQQCFGNLKTMFDTAHAYGRVIVCEEI